ncbi:MAG TPA: RNA polymerase sigma-54 factor, partial [Burkholderiaceae bacterium]|nr:RNA polymerase sigma-54 factor [Burkholderiaceae bacterium]
MIYTELRTSQRQTQTLSPRLQHAVRLLQMSSLDFSAMVHDMLGRNPFLEAAEMAESSEEGEPLPAPPSGAEPTPAEAVEAALPGEAILPDDREIWNAEGG